MAFGFAGIVLRFALFIFGGYLNGFGWGGNLSGSFLPVLIRALFVVSIVYALLAYRIFLNRDERTMLRGMLPGGKR